VAVVEVLDQRITVALTEHGVALELHEREVSLEAAGYDGEQVGEDVVGVLELDAAQVTGVAADVGDHEKPLLHRARHRSRW
jgi:hypothetical protein